MPRCLAAFCAGAVALHGLPALPPPAAACGLLLLALLLASGRPVLAAACAGFALGQLAAAQALAGDLPCARDKEAVELVARIREPPLEREGRTDFDAEVVRPSAGLPRRVRLAWYDADRLPATGEWVPAPPVDGTFVCNVGDVLERVSGGRWRSTPHRVTTTAAGDRLSFPFFLDPSWDAAIPDAGGTPVDRWDGQDLYAVRGTYGDYLLTKVARVFPELWSKQ